MERGHVIAKHPLVWSCLHLRRQLSEEVIDFSSAEDTFALACTLVFQHFLKAWGHHPRFLEIGRTFGPEYSFHHNIALFLTASYLYEAGNRVGLAIPVSGEQTHAMSIPADRTLSSPNRMVWNHFFALRRAVARVQTEEHPDTHKQEAAVVVFLAVTVVEVFLTIFFRVLVSEERHRAHRDRLLRDLDSRVTLRQKLRTWPRTILGVELDESDGLGAEFHRLRLLRNALMHFTSTHETLDPIPGVRINGLADTSIYDTLGPETASWALETAEYNTIHSRPWIPVRFHLRQLVRFLCEATRRKKQLTPTTQAFLVLVRCQSSSAPRGTACTVKDLSCASFLKGLLRGLAIFRVGSVFSGGPDAVVQWSAHAE